MKRLRPEAGEAAPEGTGRHIRPEVWMKDLVRNGFLNVPECAYTCLTTWRRMVDAQAPGLAGETESHGGYRLRLGLEIRPDGKHGQAVPAHAELQKHGRPSRRMEGRDTHADRISGPRTTSLPEPVADSWLVLHKQSRKVNDINTNIYWFYGKESRLFARYLSFCRCRYLFHRELDSGQCYKGALCFYNGTGTCRRALFRESVTRGRKTLCRACSP